MTGDRLAAVCAETVTAVPERVSAGAHATRSPARRAPTAVRRAVDDRGHHGRALPHRAAACAGSVVVSQVSPGRKNRLQFEIAGADATLGFDQEQPERCGSAGARRRRWSRRDPAHLAPGGRPLRVLPPGHPQGYQDCFDAFVADTYRAIAPAAADAVDGLPTFADGARAADITDAVLRSAAHGGWSRRSRRCRS